MISLRSFAALVLGVFAFSASANATPTPISGFVTGYSGITGSGTVFSATNADSGSATVTGLLNGQNKITFDFTYTGSGNFASAVNNTLSGQGTVGSLNSALSYILTNGAVSSASYTDAAGLLVASSNLTKTGGTISLTNLSTSQLFFSELFSVTSLLAGTLTMTYTVSSVPVPAALPLFALALAAMAMMAYRRRKA